MCGIVGWYRHREGLWDRHISIKSMVSKIAHRGPDGAEVFTSSACSLGATRLAMLGIDQPTVLVHSPDQGLVMAFNGEVYNHREIRTYLASQGIIVPGQTDGDVVLALYAHLGNTSEFLSVLDGMFAMAIYNTRLRSLLVARDRLGIKPLYVRPMPWGIAFSSENGPLSLFGPLSIDPIAISHYFSLRFIPAPSTIFREVRKMEPGSWQSWSQEGKVNEKSFWRPVPRYHRTEDTRQIFSRAATSTAQAQAPLGYWFSGGLDSSALLRWNRHRRPKSVAFSVAYSIDGRPLTDPDIRRYAAKWKIPHKQALIEEKDISPLLQQTCAFLDEPLYSTVSVGTFALARLSARTLKGVLSGDGIDELAMSYTYLRPVFLAWKSGQNWEEIYLRQVGWLPFSPKDILEEYRPSTFSSLLVPPRLSPMDRIRFFELRYRLADYHLARVDRMSMASGLEVRLPYLRNEVVDWALGQSPIALLESKINKLSLRCATQDVLPSKLAQKTKAPFFAPWQQWIDGPLKEEFAALVHDQGLLRDLGINAQALLRAHHRESLDAYGRASVAWGCMVLLMWYRTWREGPHSTHTRGE